MQSHGVFGMALVFFTMILLVGGLEHFLFFHILGIMIPTDLYFSEGVETTSQFTMILRLMEWYMVYPEGTGI